MLKILKLLGAVVASTALAVPACAQAQPGYPNKPVRVIVGYAAGGATDNLTRQISVGLGEKLGQPIVVDNKPGGSTVIAAQALISAPADGYTIAVFDPSTVSMNQFLFKKAPYDAGKALQPVTVLTRIPFGIMVKPDFPANNLKEFISYVRAHPGVGFGSSGAGNPVHLAMESFRNTAGNLDMVHIAYKGGAPAIQDLLGGQIPTMMMDIPSAMQHIKAGKIKVIAVTTAKRSDLLPDVPTIAESGYPGFEASSWFGAFVPAGTPANVIAQLNAALRETMASEKLQVWTKAQTLEATTSTPEEFAKLVRTDADKYGKLIQQLGLSLDN
jgi:tripartite-type tricarboxylate transporter receptor subunit TctC